MNIEEKKRFLSQRLELFKNLQIVMDALEEIDRSDMNEVSKINAKYAICIAGDLATSIFKSIQNNQIEGIQNLLILIEQHTSHLKKESV